MNKQDFVERDGELPEIEIFQIDESRTGRLFHLDNIDFEQYFSFDLNNIFEDTVVSVCYIQKHIYSQLLSFIESIVEEKKTFEYGAFLLGRYFQNKENEYLTFVEEIIFPSEYQYHDDESLEFGLKAMIELDQKLANNNDLTLTGWMHTHPGHTPFLSGHDLTVHQGSFVEFYQVAIVIDTLTVNYDTGIFARKGNSLMNNKIDLMKFFNFV